MQLQLTIEVCKKGDLYWARTPELNVISQGRTQEEAKENLLEVIKTQFEKMRNMGILEDYLSELFKYGLKTKYNKVSVTAKSVN